MRICHQCNISIKTPGSTCPLCGGETLPTDAQFDRAFPAIKLHPLRGFLYRMCWFLTVAVGAVSVLLNIFIFSIQKPWFLIVLALLFYGWSLYFYSIKRHKNKGQSIMMQTIGISLVLFCFDFVTGFSHWSTNYAIPGILLAGSIIGAIFMIANPLKIYEYFVYEVALILLGAIPFVLYFLHLSTVLWSGIFCLAGSLLTFLALLLCFGHDVITELKRRLHLS